jgi:hypothetical protein
MPDGVFLQQTGVVRWNYPEKISPSKSFNNISKPKIPNPGWNMDIS